VLASSRLPEHQALDMDGLPFPPHFDARSVGEVWRVPYERRAKEAPAWAAKHGLRPTGEDGFRLALVVVDAQNTFCIPGFELFVAGRSGTGAVDDNRRLCEFMYRNLGTISQVFPSLDTHDAMQVFHAIWLVDEHGEHPGPYTLVSASDVEAGRWRINEAAVAAVGIDTGYAERHLAHYTRRLAEGGKYDLTVWPYHAMLGGIGHALVSAVEEAIFFHGVARSSRPEFQIKGNSPLTEHYSMLGPEVTEGPDGERLGRPNTELVERLMAFDAVVVAGQAKSHCLAWTIDDLIEEHRIHERGLAERTYLLEDCTSPVVVPGLVDYTETADAAFEHYRNAGMQIVSSTDPLESWPGIEQRIAAANTRSAPG
jgi:nicotinamidase-related amidase